MKLGFAKNGKGFPKEDFSKRPNSDSKKRMGGLAAVVVFLAGITAGLRIAGNRKKHSDDV